MLSKKKIFLLILLLLTTLFFWNSTFLLPIKLFVVYLHEISHAIATLVSGGQVSSILIEFDESGLTNTQGGNFLFIAISGYIGSAFFGSVMLYSSLSGRFLRSVATVIGVIILYFTIFFSAQLNDRLYIGFLLCGFLFILLSVLHQASCRLLLYFGGALTSIYSVFDLADFFGQGIMFTDAGIIARRYIKDVALQQVFAYSVATLIAVISIWLMVKILRQGVFIKVPDQNSDDQYTSEGDASFADIPSNRE